MKHFLICVCVFAGVVLSSCDRDDIEDTPFYDFNQPKNEVTSDCQDTEQPNTEVDDDVSDSDAEQ